MLRTTSFTGCLLAVMWMPVHAQAQFSQFNGGEPWPSQTTSTTQNRNFDLAPSSDSDNRLGTIFLEHLAEDQKHFWTFPTRLHVQDLKWILPAAGVTAAFVASDSWISNQVPNRTNQLNFSRHVSDYGLYSLIGAGGAAYIFGSVANKPHSRETGILSAEAAIDATAVAYALKIVTARQRPYVRSEDGDFFSGSPAGNRLSFVSEHAALSWSIASVIAHEYPGPATRIAVYGLATVIAATRVTAEQHFPSDVVIGGVVGWYFGREVFRMHHDPELGGPESIVNVRQLTWSAKAWRAMGVSRIASCSRYLSLQ
ncbi:MAG TPA: phosphatase PAP2 family protein [Terriglobales bacterium]|nr:phosphatase PAP2 family protein [Terriglobales bacterium]